MTAPGSNLPEHSQHVWPALRAVVLLSLLTGIAFPLVLAGIGSAAFPDQARGSLMTPGGVVVGAALIGQSIYNPEYFHPRVSGDRARPMTTITRWFEYAAFLAILLALAKPVGLYLFRVFERQHTILDRVLCPEEVVL